MQPRPIRRALVSVSDKTGLELLAEILLEHKVEVLSTGGTWKALRDLGVPAVKISEYTGAPEILDGRVKTLHPKIHGGILALPTPDHEAEIQGQGIWPIDLVVCNLYPFRETVARPDCSFAEASENIDIGGPTMVRAAAKNWQRVGVVVDPGDYPRLAEVLREHGAGLPEGFRRKLMRKAFAHTAAYDVAIADWLAGLDDEGKILPEQQPKPSLFWVGDSELDLRYGENPHQGARFYASRSPNEELLGFHLATMLQGKVLSYNNLLDADAALELVRDLAALGPAAAVIKHCSPCGAALGSAAATITSVYCRARDADAESAFGGIVAVSRPIDLELARHLLESFLEVVIAPGIDSGAAELLAGKKNLRVLLLADMFSPDSRPRLRLRTIRGGLLGQFEDRIASLGSAKQVGKRPATARELADLELAQRVAKHVRSNAIVLVSDGVTVGIGGGQTSRVEAVRQALAKAGERARDAVVASDAFFPFRDSIDLFARAGVRAIVQPGGSVRDPEVFAAADEHELAMLVTGERHFRH